MLRFAVLIGAASHLGDQVGLQAAAIDQMLGAIIPAGSLQDDFIGTIENAHDSLRQPDIAAGIANLARRKRRRLFCSR